MGSGARHGFGLYRHRVMRLMPWLLILGLNPSVAHGEMVESLLRMPTDSASQHLFPINPSTLKPGMTQGGVLLTRESRTASIDRLTVGGERIVSETTDEAVAAGGLVDLGAGAGLGLSHQILYRKTETALDSDVRRPPREELAKIQHSTVKLLVELTEALRAGVAIRYLYKDHTIYGNPTLGVGAATRYKSTLVGYGSGFTLDLKTASFGYSYYPPLRGKTEVYGEERIIVEPGLIALDALFRPRPELVVGLLGQRWLHEVDDRARGTTAADNETRISLFGLDPDQYVQAKQLLMLGADYEFNKAVMLRLAAGQEEAELNYRDYLVYERVGVRPRRRDSESIKYQRFRVAMRFKPNPKVGADVGLGVVKRDFDYPEAMGGGRYESKSREMFGAVNVDM